MLVYVMVFVGGMCMHVRSLVLAALSDFFFFLRKESKKTPDSTPLPLYIEVTHLQTNLAHLQTTPSLAWRMVLKDFTSDVIISS